MAPFNAQLRVIDGGTLTLDDTVTVSGQGYVTGYGAGNAVVNDGLIHANQSNDYLRITLRDVHEHGHAASFERGGPRALHDWDNNGTIELDTGRLYLYGDRATENLNQSTLVRGAGSTVFLAGSLDNTGTCCRRSARSTSSGVR